MQYVYGRQLHGGGGGSVVTCPVGDMMPDATHTIEIHVRLDTTLACGSTLENSAAARWDEDGDPRHGPAGPRGGEQHGRPPT